MSGNPKCYRAAASATLVCALLTCATAGQASESSYTSIAENRCRKFDVLKIDDSEYAVSRVCTGRAGYKVFIHEEDLRETLTVGRTLKQAAEEPAARDAFGTFNGYDHRIEWRSGADEKPYALIVGWSFADNDDPDNKGRPKSVRLLVVMRLPPGPVCKVAYVDRAANTDADERARKAADEVARNFRCETDDVQVIGKSGPSIDAMARQSHERRPKP